MKVIPLNKIHPTAIIGDQVKLGTNNTIGPYVVIVGNVTIGDNNWIGTHTSIGGPAEIRNADLPQDWQNGIHQGNVTIGDNNVIREACVIHSGFLTGTFISDHCYIMNQTYIAHDCNIGAQVTLSSNVALGGHVLVQEGANLGMGTLVHQRRIIGTSSILGMGSIVARDVLPFSKAYGNPCRTHGTNVIGMQRNGFTEEEIEQASQLLMNRNPVNISTQLSDIFNNFHRISNPTNHGD